MLKNRSVTMYLIAKRALDILLSLLALIVLSPVLLAVAAVVKATSRGPVIFRQERSGRDRSVFTIYKFRTMLVSAPRMMPTHQFSDAGAYLTPVGGFLRNSSLDELPQLLNILKGEMSVVGPRPALPNQLDLLDERDRYGANALRPGLSGWAQINGRDEIPISQKAAYDGEYVRRMSFLFDVKCVLGTLLGHANPDQARVRGGKNA